MEELIPLLLVVVVLATAIGWVLSRGNDRHQLSHEPPGAIESGDQWYRQALRMARLLERIRNDDMIRVTFPQPLTAEVDAALKRFWSDVDGES